MKLYLMRHAHAAEGDREDRTRTLDDVGELQCEVMRKFMKTCHLEPDVILTSEFARAVDTAEYLQRKDAEVIQVPALNPPDVSADLDKAVTAAWSAVLKLAKDAKTVMVVTHGPLIQPFLAAVAFGVNQAWEFAHGTMVYANTHESKLRWIVTPKLAAHLADEDPKDVENPPDPDVYEPEEMAEALREAQRAVVQPQVTQVRKALRIRWRAQLKNLEENGLPLLKNAFDDRMQGATVPSGDVGRALASIPIRHKQFGVKFRKATRAAYDAGAELLTDQLPAKVTEAPRKPQNLPGPTREPGELEDELDQTTEERTSSFIGQAFKDGLAYGALVLGTRALFNGFDDTRGKTTAFHEVWGGYQAGKRDVARAHEATLEKSWNIGAEGCEICQGNAEDGWIPEDAPHDSGDDSPPAHPNCDCDEDYRPVEESDDEEE